VSEIDEPVPSNHQDTIHTSTSRHQEQNCDSVKAPKRTIYDKLGLTVTIIITTTTTTITATTKIVILDTTQEMQYKLGL
jgi:hypothetical protein